MSPYIHPHKRDHALRQLQIEVHDLRARLLNWTVAAFGLGFATGALLAVSR